MTDSRNHDRRSSDEPLNGSDGTANRRRFLAGAATAGVASVAGCFGMFNDDSGGEPMEFSLADFRGSGPLVSSRPEPEGTSIRDLPDLDGELGIYLGGGEGGLYRDLLDLFSNIYPEFSYQSSQASSSQLSSKILEEVDAGVSEADVFLAVDAGSVGNVAQNGGAQSLPSEVTEAVRSELHAEGWVGFAGRARAVPYNANRLSASDIPDTVQDFPGAGFSSSMGWAPEYGAFQAFITAMRLIRGDSETRAWLNDMADAGVERYGNEFAVSNEVANGALTAGFANHYYSLRVRNQRQNAPIELAFTSGDAGALINVSGAQVIEGADNADLAENLIRHLLSSEAQEYFATQAFAYPTIPGVNPVGGLPTIDELDLPDIDLAALADTRATLELLRETGIL
jgi:iron(III) transport system substrate-binding protein